MKRTILFFIIPILALLLAVGCCDCRKQARNVKPLVGTKWQLVQIMARDVQTDGDKYTLTLHDNGTVSAMGGCNYISGTYRMTSSRELDITNTATTLRMCNDTMESDYFSMLEAVTHYEMDGSMMLLLKIGELIAIMQAAEL